MEANSIVNLVRFGENIIELQIHENCNFFIPVNILTPFAHALFSWVALHIIVCVLLCLN